ncbi:flagellar basal body L-ring protein FlgH [Comamonas composti]|uniref:flagellar basal body L-ring protein FlgH n=1 Tax=Comamonas composti TaxID=408558 RepID=UPI000405BA27|nr:flagellar basal body L-ring protein FlgH [Comamonas composti]
MTYTPHLLPLTGIGLVLLLSGCASLNEPPPVDMPATAPPVLQPASPSAAQPTGGLFNTASYRPVFENRRARLAGDLVTVQIVERVSASQKSNSKLGRDNEIKAGITALPLFSGNAASNLASRSKIGVSNDAKFDGSGSTSSDNTFTGSISATVTDVLPNGHLLITGEKQIGVNHNVDVLRFSGTVDPRALQPGNVIASTQVANVRVESRSRGQAGEAQSMGWLSRFFLNVTPF